MRFCLRGYCLGDYVSECLSVGGECLDTAANCLTKPLGDIDREFEFYDFSFLKFNEFYDFFSVEKNS